MPYIRLNELDKIHDRLGTALIELERGNTEMAKHEIGQAKELVNKLRS